MVESTTSPHSPLVTEPPGTTEAPWWRDAVIYQINTRQFTPEGTFAAARAQLPRLRELGVDILWLMPIHEIGVQFSDQDGGNARRKIETYLAGALQAELNVM